MCSLAHDRDQILKPASDRNVSNIPTPTIKFENLNEWLPVAKAGLLGFFIKMPTQMNHGSHGTHHCFLATVKIE
jgi:hypothetical protein